MNTPEKSSSGTFIWHDLAAADTAAALEFYHAVFGWTGITEYVNGGQFTRLNSNGKTVGSMYNMSQRERQYGMPSHWTSYVKVENIESVIKNVEKAGGFVLVRSFVVDGVARIALVSDNIGSIIGLWESLSNE